MVTKCDETWLRLIPQSRFVSRRDVPTHCRNRFYFGAFGKFNLIFLMSPTTKVSHLRPRSHETDFRMRKFVEQTLILIRVTPHRHTKLSCLQILDGPCAVWLHITYPPLRGSLLWIYIISYFLQGIYLHKMTLHTMDGHWTQQDRKTERKPVDKWPNKGNSIQLYKTRFWAPRWTNSNFFWLEIRRRC